MASVMKSALSPFAAEANVPRYSASSVYQILDRKWTDAHINAVRPS